MAIYYPRVVAALDLVPHYGDDRTLDLDFSDMSNLDGKQTPKIPYLVPTEATVVLNAYRQADSFSMTFDNRRYQLDPKHYASMSAEIYVFQTSSLDEDLEKYQIPDNLAVVGIVDMQRSSRSADGSTFTVEGQDYTALLLAKQWDPSRNVQPGRSIVDTVQQLVNEALNASDGERSLQVVYESFDHDTAPKVQGFGRNRLGIPFKNDKTYWDVITELCSMVALRVFVRRLQVVISTPQDQIAMSHSVDDPFRIPDSIDVGTTAFALIPSLERKRVFAYGRNISTLTAQRKSGRNKAQTIEVSSRAKNGEIITAQYPPEKNFAAETKAKRKKKNASAAHRGTDGVLGSKSSIAQPDEPIKRSFVHGVSDAGTLARIAETKYHEAIRGDYEIEFETSDLSDLEGRSVLYLRAGDPVVVELDPFNDAEMARLNKAQRRAFLDSQGYSADIAQFIAQQYDNIEKFSAPYYTQEAQFNWSISSGLSVQVKAANYINVKYGLPKNEKTSK